MNVKYNWATQLTHVLLEPAELNKLVTWFEHTTNPAPDPDADAPTKLEDMLREILDA